MHGGWNIIDHGGHMTNTGNHVAEAFERNDEHVELSGSHKPTGTYIAWWPYTIYNRKVENSFYTVLLFTE
jgi:hypothetical protein